MAERSTDALATLSHELRTPVSTIVAAAAGLERGGDELSPEKQRALIRLVTSEANRLARLVDDVLTASRLDANELPIHLASTDVDALTASAVAAAQTTAPDRSITHEAVAGTTALADPDRLRQVIDNLIDNAMKHGAGAIGVRVRRDDQVVRIEISDDGPGVPAEQRGAIFDKFCRLESPAPGSGLGLWLCHELVTRMNGRIWVTAPPAGGACFVTEVPAVADVS